VEKITVAKYLYDVNGAPFPDNCYSFIAHFYKNVFLFGCEHFFLIINRYIPLASDTFMDLRALVLAVSAKI
jgi:hypothetical protein